MTDIAKKATKGHKAEIKPEDVTLEEATPAFMLKRINALKNVQLKMVNLEAKFYEELHQLECKYAKIYEPIYEKRKAIVTGAVEPTEEEGKWALDEQNMTDEEKKAAEEANKAEDPKAEKTKGIENFWLETLQSFRITAEIIQEHDEPLLAFLEDVRVTLTTEKPYGYTLEFYFAENPYFTDRVLTKTYELKTDVDEKDPFSYEGPDLAKTTGCTINWNAGKNVCVKMERRKIKSKNKKAPAKVIHKEVKQDSFFNFFETPKLTAKSPATSGTEGSRKVSMRSADESEMDEEDQEEMYRIADFEIGQYIREKVIPKAVLYYTGEYDGMDDEYEDYEDEDDEEGDDDEDDDDEDDDDEDEDDEEEDHHHKKGAKGGIKGKPGKHHKGGHAHQAKGGEPTPSECKQN